MITKKHIVAIASAASLMAAGAVAASESAEGWQSSAELGIVNTSGNSETSTVNAKFNAKREQEKWRHSIGFSALGTSATDTTTNVKTTSAEKYALNGKSDYKFNEYDFMFGSLDYEKDLFSGYDYEATLVLGYGRRLINDENMKFDAEIGPGARKVKAATSGLTETDGIVRVGAKLDWKISKTATFTESFTADFSSEFDTIKSVSALTAKVNSKLALKVSLTIKNNSEVPVGTEKTDTETAVTLVYSF